MDKPTFTRWVPLVERAGWASRTSSNDDFRQATAKMLEQGSRLGGEGAKNVTNCKPFIQALSSEIAWHKFGRPYYKIWPGIAWALSKTRFSFSATQLHFPYRAFVVMFPHELPGSRIILIEQEGVTRPGERAGNQSESERENCRRLGPVAHSISLQFSAAGLSGWHGRREHFNIRTEETVEEALARRMDMIPTQQLNHDEGLVPIDPSFAREEWEDSKLRAAIGAAMFAVNSHELVLPDADFDEKNKVGRAKGASRIKEMRIARELAKNTGWRVGSELVLPRPIAHGSTGSESTGRELTHGHIRSGHMKMQACGPGWKEHRLIFVAPCVVRPDLPERTTHGYRIQDKILPRKKRQQSHAPAHDATAGNQ